MPPMPEPTIAAIERGVVYTTYVVKTYGERYATIRDRLIMELETRQQRLPSPEMSMPKRPRPLPDRSEITDDTPLHLETAARLAFPDGVVSGLALRNAAARGDLEYERLGGRVIMTLRWIREWRERNRHPARPRRETPKPDAAEARDTTLAMLTAQQTLARLRKQTKVEGHARRAKAPKDQR